MVSKERATRWLCYLGVLGMGGAILNGRPATFVFAALLLTPYGYVHYQKGRSESQAATGN